MSSNLHQVLTQVKTNQEILTQRLNEELEKAVLHNRNAATVDVDGKKFTCQATMSSYDRDYNLYLVILAKPESKDPYAPSKRYFTLDEAHKGLWKTTRKVIKSGTVLRTVFTSRLGTVVSVSNQAEVVERFVAEVCKELGWPYVSLRKREFNARVQMLRGEQSYID